MTTCDRCGEVNPADIHTCTPPSAPVQEPVAWMYDFLNPDNRDEVIRNWTTQDYSDIEREIGFNVRPLYTTPPAQPAPVQEPVAIPDCGEAGHADGACGNRECLPSFRRNTTPPAQPEIETLEVENKMLRARNERLEASHAEWISKTDWVQESVRPKELGLHRADVLRQRIDRLEGELSALAEQVAKRLEQAGAGMQAGLIREVFITKSHP